MQPGPLVRVLRRFAAIFDANRHKSWGTLVELAVYVGAASPSIHVGAPQCGWCRVEEGAAPVSDRTQPFSRIAARQQGLITRAQLVESGLSGPQVDRLLCSGRLIPVARGVHLVAGAPYTWHVRLLAACLAVDGVASHRSAAALHGIDGFRPGRPELSVPRAHHAGSAQGRIHWSTDLVLTTPVRVGGIPTTPIDRTVLDLGAVCSDDVVERAIDFAIGRRLLTWPDVLDVYRAHSRPGRRGCGAVRRILEQRFDEGHRVESPLEADVRRLFLDAGLGGFETQVEVFDASGFVLRGDFGWLRELVIVEVDSLAFHLNVQRFGVDKAQRTRARMAGWFVFEYTALDVRSQPDRVVREVRTVLRERGARR